MKYWVLFILTFVLALSSAQAEAYRRNVEFEWDAIEGAKSYEVLIEKDEKAEKFKTAKPQWQGALAPGIYQMKVRALDRRGVPGDWSATEDLKVNLETAKLLLPAPGDLASDQDEEAKVSFKWEPVPGAEHYQFELVSEDGTIQKQETLQASDHTADLPVAKKYIWKVKAVGRGRESDEVANRKFTLLGNQLKAPEIQAPETRFVRELKWSQPEHASLYRYQLERYNSKFKKWEPVHEHDQLSENRLPFDPHWAGGRYRFHVQALGTDRAPSSESELIFWVKSGDRSPAAEEIATLRLSIERRTGWYAIASYLITMTDYKGMNYDKTNTSLSYSAIGGTGRLGAGYLSKSSPWGFVGVADLSGIKVGSETYTFASAESNAIHRVQTGARSELRQQFGVFYKELPETLGKSSGAITENNLLKTAGPHYGAEYWIALTSKLGFQLNVHLYPGLLTIQTPTGESIRPALSAQAGLLGSYRLGKDITGLMGYAYRQDRTEYKARPGLGSAAMGDHNSVLITGHYLNLFLEWAL